MEYPKLKQELGKMDISNDLPTEKLIQFENMLLEWNEKINITRITSREEIEIKHFLDSLSILSLSQLNSVKTVIDVGTGGGFPGIPCKLVRPEWDITLLDSLNKRITFLNQVINSLELKDIIALHGRAEELGRENRYRENYDLCVSRAVASLNTLAEYCLPFVKIGGYFLAMKGSEYQEELKESQNALELLGGEIAEVKEVNLPGDINHSLILIQKKKATPKKYPRGGGKPKKYPL